MAPTTPPEAQSTGAPSNGNNNGNNGNASHQPPAPLPSSSSVNDHLAQALRDLARGEQTASALETNLSNLESKLDDILASFGVPAADLDALEDDDGQEEPVQKDKEDRDGKGKGGAAGADKGEGKGV